MTKSGFIAKVWSEPTEMYIHSPPYPTLLYSTLSLPYLPYPTFSVIKKGAWDIKVFLHFLYFSLAEVKIVPHFTGIPQHPETSFQ